MIEFLMGKNYRIVMDKDAFKEKMYYKISKQSKDDSGRWKFSKQTILIPEELGVDFCEALEAFIEQIRGDGGKGDTEAEDLEMVDE